MSHFQGHPRDAFIDGVDNGRPQDVVLEVNYSPVSEPSAQFLVSFLGCSDVMPSLLCSELDMEPGRTYGQAAEQLLPEYVSAVLVAGSGAPAGSGRGS